MPSESQKPKTITVTVATAGTAQRVVSDASSPLRYARSAHFTPADTNTGLVYLGDEAVSSSSYADFLDAASFDRIEWVGDRINSNPADRLNYCDLYNMWVDAENNGDGLFVTIGII